MIATKKIVALSTKNIFGNPQRTVLTDEKELVFNGIKSEMIAPAIIVVMKCFSASCCWSELLKSVVNKIDIGARNFPKRIRRPMNSSVDEYVCQSPKNGIKMREPSRRHEIKKPQK